MFRSLCCRVGANLKTRATTINGQSHPSSAAAETRYILFTLQNPNVLIKPRVTSMFFSSKLSSFFTSNTVSTPPPSYDSSMVTSNKLSSSPPKLSSFFTSNNVSSSSSSSDPSFVVSYLINSCGLSENVAITASKKVDFKTTLQPDSVIKLLENYGFPKPHISNLIAKRPLILLSDPLGTLKPKLDFFDSKGLHGIELADFISRAPDALTLDLENKIVHSFNILKSIVRADTNVIKLLQRSHSWIFRTNLDKILMVNLELLRSEGVPESIIVKYLIDKPVLFVVSADKFKKVVEKVKEMGFDPLAASYFLAIKGLTAVSEASWRKKTDVYKRWGLSEDQIQSAFKKDPRCMMLSETKITEVMDFLVNEMGYDSLSIAETPAILNNSLKGRIIPRCSVIRILVSKALIKEKVSVMALARMSDKSFSVRFVKPYEQEAPELLKVFQDQLNNGELLSK